ncbi:MAG: hypothetical protein ACREOO_19485 [bacterium]
MKSFSRKLRIVSLALLLSLSSLQGQTVQSSDLGTESPQLRQKILIRGVRGYQANLRSGVDAITESTMLHSVVMRIKFPDQDYAKIISELKRLSFEASNPGLRYKAYLTASIMPNPEVFFTPVEIERLLAQTEETRNEFFGLIAAALENRISD